jgi:hypothetical protein
MSISVSWTRLLGDRRLFALLALTVVGVTLAYQRSEPYQVSLGTSRDDVVLEGFHGPEGSQAAPFRWTGARADVRLPNLWPAQPVRLDLVLSAPRPGGASVPVTISVNGRLLDTLAIGPAPHALTYVLPADTLGASGNLYLTLWTPTFTPAGDTRELGVAVSRIAVAPLDQAPFLPSLPVLATLGAFVVLLYVWLRRLAVSPNAAFGAALVAIVALTAALLLARPIITLYNAQLLFTLAVAFTASAGATRLGHFQNNIAALRWTGLLFLGAFAIRMVLAHAPGDSANFIAFKLMIAQVAQQGLASIYELDPVVGAYPPVHHYDWTLIAFFYRTFVSPDFNLDSLRLNFMMKMPTVVLDMLITVILIGYAARRRGARFALLAGAAYALNPGIIYTSAYNGQLGDPLYSLFVTAAVVALLAGRPLAFGSAAALALLTKPQASAFLPFFVIAGLCCLQVSAAWFQGGEEKAPGYVEKPEAQTGDAPPGRSRGSIRARMFSRAVQMAILGGVTTALLVLLPFLLAGTVGGMLRTVSTTIGHGPHLSANAYNIWWLLGWGNAWNIPDTGLLFGVLSYRAAGLVLLFVVANGLIAYKLWSHCDARALALLAAFAGLAFFMLPTEIHENYLFPTIPLLALCTVHDRRAWPVLAVLSATWFINLIFVDVDLVDLLNAWWPWLGAVMFPVQVVAALMNVGVLLAWAWWLVRYDSRRRLELAT